MTSPEEVNGKHGMYALYGVVDDTGEKGCGKEKEMELDEVDERDCWNESRGDGVAW